MLAFAFDSYLRPHRAWLLSTSIFPACIKTKVTAPPSMRTKRVEESARRIPDSEDSDVFQTFRNSFLDEYSNSFRFQVFHSISVIVSAILFVKFDHARVTRSQTDFAKRMCRTIATQKIKKKNKNGAETKTRLLQPE